MIIRTNKQIKLKQQFLQQKKYYKYGFEISFKSKNIFVLFKYILYQKLVCCKFYYYVKTSVFSIYMLYQDQCVKFL